MSKKNPAEAQVLAAFGEFVKDLERERTVIWVSIEQGDHASVLVAIQRARRALEKMEAISTSHLRAAAGKASGSIK
jgi:hypothetical protein